MSVLKREETKQINMGSETYKIEKREKKDRNKVVENEKLDKI